MISAAPDSDDKSALRVVPGWSPLQIGPVVSDDQVFETVTAAVFQARFNPAIVRQRWPCIRRAFTVFDLRAVAAWSDGSLADLLAADGMIRNPKKIRATLGNSRSLLALSQQFDGLQAYLSSFGTDREALVRDIDTWARYIGAPSIRWAVQTLEPALPRVQNTP